MSSLVFLPAALCWWALKKLNKHKLKVKVAGWLAGQKMTLQTQTDRQPENIISPDPSASFILFYFTSADNFR